MKKIEAGSFNQKNKNILNLGLLFVVFLVISCQDIKKIEKPENLKT